MPTEKQQLPTNGAQLRVLRVNVEPASLLIELQGTDANGLPAFAFGHFDNYMLARQIFPDLFALAMESLLQMMETDRLRAFSMPITHGEMSAIHDAQLVEDSYPKVLEVAKFARVVGKLENERVCAWLREMVGIIVSQGMPAGFDVHGKLETAPAAPGKSEGGSPPHAGASGLEDGKSLSTEAAS